MHFYCENYPSIDAYSLEERSCQISLRSELKLWSLFLKMLPHQKNEKLKKKNDDDDDDDDE